MAELTPTRRRWYQFQLSTILVLIAIAAWAMSMHPWIIRDEDVRVTTLPAATPVPAGYETYRYPGQRPGTYTDAETGKPIIFVRPIKHRLKKSLDYPLDALILFLGWRGFINWRASRPAPAPQS